MVPYIQLDSMPRFGVSWEGNHLTCFNHEITTQVGFRLLHGALGAQESLGE